jgi:hypothetical protein
MAVMIGDGQLAVRAHERYPGNSNNSYIRTLIFPTMAYPVTTVAGSLYSGQE